MQFPIILPKLNMDRSRISGKATCLQCPMSADDVCFVVIAGCMGTAEIEAADNPYLRQFLNALPDGPVRFHFPAPPLEQDLRLTREQ